MADRPSTPIRWVVAGALGGIVLGSMGIAVAQTGGSTTTAPLSSSTAPAAPGAQEQRGEKPAKVELTGEVAEKVRAAARAAVPGGAVVRMHEGRDGGYVAMVTRPDGARVAVKLDDSFTVTSVEERKHCHLGHRGPGSRPAVTGEAAEKATAAATAAVPGATVDRVVEGRDGGYVALVTKADGTRAAVKMDGSFNVTSVEDKAGRPRGRHRHGPPPAASAGEGPEQDGTATPTNV
jgi:hypothetical protein